MQTTQEGQSPESSLRPLHCEANVLIGWPLCRPTSNPEVIKLYKGMVAKEKKQKTKKHHGYELSNITNKVQATDGHWSWASLQADG